MEPFYSALHGEIRAFEEHVQRCQKDFDLHTLYQVLLLLLPGSPTSELRSLGQLERLVEGWDWPGQDPGRATGSAANWDIPGYVAWLGSYLGYLCALKETFDAKVVFPLCEHLYVHEEPEAEARSPWGIPSGSGAAHRGQKRPQAVPSIAEVAKQLFAGRRKWAQLLHGRGIDDHVLSPQSQSILKGFANARPVAPVLRLVPDIFHQSLATAALARQWLCLHGRSYIHQLPPAPGPQGQRRTGLAPGAPAEHGRHGEATGCLEPAAGCSPFPGDQSQARPHSGCSPFPGDQSQARPHSGCSPHEGGTGLGRGSAARAKLWETREELMGLLWRAERARELGKQLQRLTQSIASLQREQQETRRQLDAFQQRLGQANWTTPGSRLLLSGQCQAALRQLEELEWQLELEEYRQSLLQSDWLLELELRPWLVRQIEAAQQHCHELEQMLQARAPATASPLPANGMDSASRCDSGHGSTASPTPANKA